MDFQRVRTFLSQSDLSILQTSQSQVLRCVRACKCGTKDDEVSTISAKLQLRRYTSAFKLKSNCNLPAVSMSWICTGPVGPAPSIAPVPAKIPFLSADTFLTNPTNAQKSGLNSTSPDISVETVIKYLNISDRRMARAHSNVKVATPALLITEALLLHNLSLACSWCGGT